MGEEVHARSQLAKVAELEKATLGGVLLDSAVLPQVIGQLDPEDFYLPKEQRIYRAILEAHGEGVVVDFLSIYDRLHDMEFSEFAKLYDYALPGSADYLAKQLKEYSRRRRGQQAMMSSIETLAAPGADLNVQFEYLSNDFIGLMREDEGTTGLAEQQIISMKRLEHQMDSDLIKTGLRPLDLMLGGMQKGELWVIAGRPSMGKSALAANCALGIAEQGNFAFYISVEGTNHSLMCRLWSIKSGVPLSKIRTGNLNLMERTKLIESAERFSALDTLCLSDTESRWDKIKANIQLLKLKDPRLAVVFIDYIGLVSGNNINDRRQELEYMSADAKRLAGSLKIVMVLLIQLNRQPELRTEHRPKLSDLRESGAFEQDADVVLMLYRSAYYSQNENDNTAELAVSKNREGPTGMIELGFVPECVLFTEIQEV